MSKEQDERVKASDHKLVLVASIPRCDFDQDAWVDAVVDGKTVMGPWANMCEKHNAQYGVGLGLGRGQRLELRLPDEDQSKEQA